MTNDETITVDAVEEITNKKAELRKKLLIGAGVVVGIIAFSKVLNRKKSDPESADEQEILDQLNTGEITVD